MSLTWVGTSPSDEQAFACFNTALENGANFWNFGTFYSKTDKMDNLLLLKRYFDKVRWILAPPRRSCSS
jgi:pyridoxine 4-dehydrogenase